MWLNLWVLPLLAADLFTNFRPSPIQSPYGVTTQVEFSTRLAELESGALAHHLAGTMKNFRFVQVSPAWVILASIETL